MLDLIHRRLRGPRPRTATACLLALAAMLSGEFSGCAAFTFPVQGIPAYRIPAELLAEPRDDLKTINLALLRRCPEDEYRLSAGDVLGIWVEDLGGALGTLPPIRFAQQVEHPEPGVGVPFMIREDGAIDLPDVGEVIVAGRTITEAKQVILNAYVERQILQPNFKRLVVTLSQPRTNHILVLRQEGDISVVNSPTVYGATVRVGRFKKGTGYSVDLPADRSDVLNALSLTGGLPGLDAINAIVIYRGCFEKPGERKSVLDQLDAGSPIEKLGMTEIRIPVRMRYGTPLPFQPEDVVLQTGDVIFIETRDQEVFYTAGLLPANELIIPRDYDLDVVEAVSMAHGPQQTGGLFIGGQVVTTVQPLNGGIGGPSPSLLIVMRRTPDGRQVPIRVDLNRALRDPRERILVKAGDVLILQQTPDEALARYLTGVITFEVFWQTFTHKEAAGATSILLP